MKQKFGTFDDLFGFFQDFDRLFHRTMWQARELPEEVFGMPRMLPVAKRAAFNPPVECYTKDRQLVLRAELPGVDPKDVEVTINGNQIYLRGEKKEEQKVDEKDLFFQELARGRFERTFTLPDGVKPEQVRAWFNNGVLEVTMPAATIEPARKVLIEIGEAKKVKAA